MTIIEPVRLRFIESILSPDWIFPALTIALLLLSLGLIELCDRLMREGS